MKSPPESAPSGKQWAICWDGGPCAARANVVELGGGLRECELGGMAVLDSFPFNAVCDGDHKRTHRPYHGHQPE